MKRTFLACVMHLLAYYSTISGGFPCGPGPERCNNSLSPQATFQRFQSQAGALLVLCAGLALASSRRHALARLAGLVVKGRGPATNTGEGPAEEEERVRQRKRVR